MWIPSSLGEEEGKNLSHCSPISMPLDGPTWSGGSTSQRRLGSRSAGVKEGAWAGETMACERGRGEGLAAGVLEGVVVADELAAGGAEVDDVAAGSLGGDDAALVVWQPRIWDRDGQTESHHGRILRKPGAGRRSGVGTEKTRRGRGR